MFVLVSLFVFVVLFVAIPTLMWFGTRPDAERAWEPRQVGTERVRRGSYRDVDVPRFSDGGPPFLIHLASMSSWVLGMMFVPGLLAGLFGLLAAGIGAVSIPGLILAWRIFFLGAPLLRADLDAASRARSAAHFSRVLNAVVLLLCAAATLLLLPSAWRSRPHADISAMLAAGAVAFYAFISLTHAKLLDVAADLIDEQNSDVVTRVGVRVDEVVQSNEAPRAPEFEEVAVERDEAPPKQALINTPKTHH